MIKSGDTENALEDWEHDKRGMTAGLKSWANFHIQLDP